MGDDDSSPSAVEVAESAGDLQVGRIGGGSSRLPSSAEARGGRGGGDDRGEDVVRGPAKKASETRWLARNLQGARRERPRNGCGCVVSRPEAVPRAGREGLPSRDQQQARAKSPAARSRCLLASPVFFSAVGMAGGRSWQPGMQQSRGWRLVVFAVATRFYRETGKSVKG